MREKPEEPQGEEPQAVTETMRAEVKYMLAVLIARSINEGLQREADKYLRPFPSRRRDRK